MDEQLNSLPSLPPALQGKICGILHISLGQISFLSKKYTPETCVIRIRFWGEKQAGVYLKQVLNRPALRAYNPEGNSVDYTIRCTQQLFTKYLNDMGHLNLEVIDDDSSELLGIVKVNIKSHLVRDSSVQNNEVFTLEVNNSYQILQKEQRIGELRVKMYTDFTDWRNQPVRESEAVLSSFQLNELRVTHENPDDEDQKPELHTIKVPKSMLTKIDPPEEPNVVDSYDRGLEEIRKRGEMLRKKVEEAEAKRNSEFYPVEPSPYLDYEIPKISDIEIIDEVPSKDNTATFGVEISASELRRSKIKDQIENDSKQFRGVQENWKMPPESSVKQVHSVPENLRPVPEEFSQFTPSPQAPQQPPPTEKIPLTPLSQPTRTFQLYLLLESLTQISPRADGGPRNIYISYKNFPDNERINTEVFWGYKDGAAVGHRMITPIVHDPNTLQKLYKGFIAVEVWDKIGTSSDELLGLVKLPLQLFGTALSTNITALVEGTYPFVAVDEYRPVQDLRSRQDRGYLKVCLALGTSAQVHKLQLSENVQYQNEQKRLSPSPVKQKVQRQQIEQYPELAVQDSIESISDIASWLNHKEQQLKTAPDQKPSPPRTPEPPAQIKPQKQQNKPQTAPIQKPKAVLAKNIKHTFQVYLKSITCNLISQLPNSQFFLKIQFPLESKPIESNLLRFVQGAAEVELKSSHDYTLVRGKSLQDYIPETIPGISCYIVRYGERSSEQTIGKALLPTEELLEMQSGEQLNRVLCVYADMNESVCSYGNDIIGKIKCSVNYNTTETSEEADQLSALTYTKQLTVNNDISQYNYIGVFLESIGDLHRALRYYKCQEIDLTSGQIFAKLSLFPDDPSLEAQYNSIFFPRFTYSQEIILNSKQQLQVIMNDPVLSYLQTKSAEVQIILVTSSREITVAHSKLSLLQLFINRQMVGEFPLLNEFGQFMGYINLSISLALEDFRPSSKSKEIQKSPAKPKAKVMDSATSPLSSPKNLYIPAKQEIQTFQRQKQFDFADQIPTRQSPTKGFKLFQQYETLAESLHVSLSLEKDDDLQSRLMNNLKALDDIGKMFSKEKQDEPVNTVKMSHQLVQPEHNLKQLQETVQGILTIYDESLHKPQEIQEQPLEIPYDNIEQPIDSEPFSEVTFRPETEPREFRQDEALHMSHLQTEKYEFAHFSPIKSFRHSFTRDDMLPEERKPTEMTFEEDDWDSSKINDMLSAIQEASQLIGDYDPMKIESPKKSEEFKHSIYKEPQPNLYSPYSSYTSQAPRDISPSPEPVPIKSPEKPSTNILPPASLRDSFSSNPYRRESPARRLPRARIHKDPEISRIAAIMKGTKQQCKHSAQNG